MTDYATNWRTTTIDGRQWLEIDGFRFRVPLDFDQSSGVFLAVAGPNGAIGNLLAFAKGDTGDPAILDETIVLDMLDYSDPTPDSGSLVLLGGNTYQAHLSIHKGAPGEAGAAVLDVASFGTPLAGRMIVLNDAADAFVYQSQLVGDRFVPSSLVSAPAGNPNYTLGAVSVPGQLFDWRPEVSGYAIVTGTGSRSVTVDLIARLNNESAGNEVGRAPGAASPNGAIQTLVAGPPAGSGSAYDKVSAGAAAVVYLRAERQSGTDTFTTVNTTTRFRVKVAPIPGTGVGE